MVLDDNSIIIADYNYFKLLYKYKNKYPTKNIKIYQKKDIIDKLAFIYVKDPIYFFINKMHIEYSKAKMYMSILRIGDISKNKELSDMYNSLVKDGYIIENDLSQLEIAGYKVYIFDSIDDRELHSFLSRNNVEYKDISFDDLDIKPANDITKMDSYLFENKYYQFSYIFSDILKRISEGANKEKINILVDDAYDLFYAKTISKLYEIPVYTNIESKIIENINIRGILDEFYSKKKICLLDNTDEYTKAVNKYIKDYDLDKLDFDFGYANLVEILSSVSVSETYGDSGIIISSSFNLNDCINYVTNFKHNSFYTEYADKNVLSDSKLVEIGINTSYDKTKIDRNRKLNYIKYNNIVMLSRVQFHLKDSIYDSDFVSEFKMNVEEIKDYDKGLHTSLSKKILYTDKYDKAFFRMPNFKEGLFTYNNKFKGIDKKVYDKDKNWYLTNLEGYINCPYKYYLNDLIPLKSDDYLARCIGSYIHKIFEKYYHKDFDLDIAFGEALDEYKAFYKDKDIEFTSKDKAFIEYVKYWIRKIIPYMDIIKEQTKFIDLDGVQDYEVSVEYKIDDFKFKGRIDKLIWTEAEGKKAYMIVDYKTGEETFDYRVVHLGKSIQLPLYYYAIEEENTDLKKDSEFAGFVIQHTFFKTLKKLFEKDKIDTDLIYKYMKMSGLLLNNDEYKDLFDTSRDNSKIYDYKNSFKDIYSPISINKKEEYEYSLLDIIEDSKKAAIETINKILNNSFEIAPAPFDLTSDNNRYMSCRGCGYRDICYKKKSDYRFYKDEIKDFFNEKRIVVEEEGEENEL